MQCRMRRQIIGFAVLFTSSLQLGAMRFDAMSSDGGCRAVVVCPCRCRVQARSAGGAGTGVPRVRATRLASRDVVCRMRLPESIGEYLCLCNVCQIDCRQAEETCFAGRMSAGMCSRSVYLCWRVLCERLGKLPRFLVSFEYPVNSPTSPDGQTMVERCV